MSTFYFSKLETLKTQKVSLQSAYNKTSNLRLALIVFGIAAVVFCFKFHIILGAVALVGFILSFFYLVKYHEATEENLQQNQNQEHLVQYELGQISDKYNNGSAFLNAHHLYSPDLDLFGSYSLFELVSRAKTHIGKTLLAEAMLTINSDTGLLKEKQKAVIELRDKAEWRIAFLASLINISDFDADNAHKITELPEPPKLKLARFFVFYGKLIPFVWVLFFVVFYQLQFEGIGLGLMAMAAFHFYLNGLNNKLTEPYLEKIGVSDKALKSFRKAAELIANEKFESQLINQILHNFPKSNLKTKNPIDEFAHIIKKLDMRKNKMAVLFLVGARPFEPIETLKLINWLKTNPGFFKEIFNAIAQLEYYASLGTLSFNNPEWAFPEFNTSDGIYLAAEKIGHPLLKNQKTVCNDFVLSTQNKVNLITGSNMSGKSTFLRTVGINLILANLGGPVFAQKLALKQGLVPFCYMRITDSIHENASTFKAEIDRIKLVLEALKAKKPYLFLIDEMLRGTNSEDKLKGSVALFEKLVAEDALALLATHDLRLSEVSDKHPDKVKNYYFEYSTKNGELEFDYQIKQGLCKSFNASILLENIGLPIGK